MDEVTRPKTFSAWIIPGMINPPFILTRTGTESAEIVLNILCEKYNITRGFLEKTPQRSNQNRRSGEHARRNDRIYFRQLFYYTMRDIYKSDAPLKMLGKLLQQDHTTVMHAVKSFSDRLFTNDVVPEAVAHKRFSKKKKVSLDYYEFQNLIRPWL